MSRAELLDLAGGRLRVRRWRDAPDTVVVVPSGEGAAIASQTVLNAVAALSARGIRCIYTAALAGADQVPFLAAGFGLHEHLHLLVHDLGHLDVPPGGAHLRRGRRRDRADVLAVDASAFDGFWRLDSTGLDDAVDATPTARLRVAVDADGDVTGYAVVGRAADRGYVQRLAVAPAAQGRGVGRALLLDGLWWLRRRGARQAVVNTQDGNDRALALYRSVGFVEQTGGLDVLAYRRTPSAS